MKNGDLGILLLLTIDVTSTSESRYRHWVELDGMDIAVEGLVAVAHGFPHRAWKTKSEKWGEDWRARWKIQ